MYKLILILDRFFSKYKGGEGGKIDTTSQEKLPSKSPALLGLISKREKLGLKHYDDCKAVIEYSIKNAI